MRIDRNPPFGPLTAALGGHGGLTSKGQVDNPPLARRHRLKRDGAAGPRYLLGDPMGQADQGFLAPHPVASRQGVEEAITSEPPEERPQGSLEPDGSSPTQLA